MERAPSRQRARGRTQAKLGLTLVEIVVAMAILGILVAVSFSGLGLVNNRRLAGAARAIASEMRNVEQRARAERRCWQVVFDPANERYEIQVLETSGTYTGAGCQPSRGSQWQRRKSVELPRAVDLEKTTFPSNRLVISPFGTLTAGEATLRTSGGATRVVIITLLGRVTIGP